MQIVTDNYRITKTGTDPGTIAAQKAAQLSPQKVTILVIVDSVGQKF